MSPVSPVFNTEVTVSIGLKMISEWEHPFHNIILRILYQSKKTKVQAQPHMIIFYLKGRNTSILCTYLLASIKQQVLLN